MRQWVGSEGEYDHSPIYLELKGSDPKPTNPFKMKSSWLKEDNFLTLVKENWKEFDSLIEDTIVKQFEGFIKLIKKFPMDWGHIKCQREKEELALVENELFNFLIHEAIGVAQEGFHNIKTHKLEGIVIKIDLSKAYDRVSWLYIRILLAHVSFGLDFISRIMSCVLPVSFVILINGSISPFLHAQRGLRQ